jgi:hypothetical protein
MADQVRTKMCMFTVHTVYKFIITKRDSCVEVRVPINPHQNGKGRKGRCFFQRLKGTVSRDFLLLVFFHGSVFPQPQSIPLGLFQIFSKICGIRWGWGELIHEKTRSNKLVTLSL